MEKWFRCFSEVPGIGYKSNPHVNRSQLSYHNAVPQVRSNEMVNGQQEYVLWPMISGGSGSTSASPVKQWITQPRKGETVAQTRLRQLYESLELPGELMDYHFAILGCSSVLWRCRREEPWVLVEIEQLCWLDIRLVQAYPTLAIVNNERGFFRITTFEHLIHLYEQEGYLFDALQVAEIAVKFNQQMPALERIKSRIANLEAERSS